MSPSTLHLKSISGLLRDGAGNPMHYHVPDYQRGYRWSPLQVTQLLNDVHQWDRHERHRQGDPDAFYCLQPLVVKWDPQNGWHEVVDGQQRLTTLYLVLSYLNTLRVERSRTQLFTISYQTRPSFDQLLADPVGPLASENVDFFHLAQAIKSIEQWFVDNPDTEDDMRAALLNRTKVIWCQLAEGDNAVAAFTRLNVGKIQLTSDELIRALLLCNSNGNGQSLEWKIAYEWDLMERDLQDDSFWYFLSREDRQHNRIGFIFSVIARAHGISEELQDDPLRDFYVFSRKLESPGQTQEKLWQEVKDEYMRLREWYEDRTIYHIVGYLLHEDWDILDVRRMAADCTKAEFDAQLRRSIFSSLLKAAYDDPMEEQSVCGQVAEHVEKTKYGTARYNAVIRSTLLLFNIASLLQDARSNVRFQFDSFKREAWDIEHVRSIAGELPTSVTLRRAWLQQCREYLQEQPETNKLVSGIDGYLTLGGADATEAAFMDLFDEITRFFREGEVPEDENGIGNLTLLPPSINRSYKNAPFAIKRTQILKLDQAGIFVPLCTRNVFLKCYSPRVNEALFWGNPDVQGYREAIKTTLASFFLNRRIQ